MGDAIINRVAIASASLSKKGAIVTPFTHEENIKKLLFFSLTIAQNIGYSPAVNLLKHVAKECYAYSSLY